jgi:hypothetical protein
MEWYYKGEVFDTTIAAEWISNGYIGFVYEITDNLTAKKYIGKKLLLSTRRLPPLKGKKKKRIKIVQSDWVNYYGSSEIVQTLVAERPHDWSREILDLCKAKGELSYIEAKYHFEKEVLLKEEYYNAFIGCRINAKHVKNLWKK